MLVSPIPIPIPGRAVIDLASQPLACCSLGSSPPSSSPLESRHHPSAPHRPERGALNVVNGTYTPPRTRCVWGCAGMRSGGAHRRARHGKGVVRGRTMVARARRTDLVAPA